MDDILPPCRLLLLSSTEVVPPPVETTRRLCRPFSTIRLAAAVTLGLTSRAVAPPLATGQSSRVPLLDLNPSLIPSTTLPYLLTIATPDGHSLTFSLSIGRARLILAAEQGANSGRLIAGSFKAR